MLSKTSQPTVFLSFAGNDRPMAKRLADDLTVYGVESFIDARDVGQGRNVVLAIDEAIGSARYYVLLWSANCVDRAWVAEEWAVAYARDVNEQRSFLFIVRLDETPLPPLLSVRKYLNGVEGWTAVARDLAYAWFGDRDTGTPVFPAPGREPEPERSILVVRVRNRALGMTHVVGVPTESAGADLLPEISTALALPTVQTQLDGVVEIQFSYRLLCGGEPVTGPVTDGATLDLEIHLRFTGPDGPLGEKVYRGRKAAVAGMPELTVGAMVDTAFAHLLP